MKTPRLASQLLAVALLCASASARQSPTAPAKHFAADGLSFEYPAGWALDDKSDAHAQRLVLTRPDSPAHIVVMAFRGRTLTAEQAQKVREQITNPIVENLARGMRVAEAPSWDSPVCEKVGDKRVAVGFRLEGEFEKQPGVAEVYALVYGRRFVNLMYVRPAKEEASSAPAWGLLRDSLRVEPPPDATPGGDTAERAVFGGLLNAKATRKVAPLYPREALANRVQGQVVVQLEVDDAGDVLWAKAVSGPNLLRHDAERAVSRWKFTPTVFCERPVNVTGTVTVDFVVMNPR